MAGSPYARRSAAAWYLAPSLVALLGEVNARWPNRDKASDGTIGDVDHQAGASEHNPDSRGCVRAVDIDKDGIDTAPLIKALVGDPRVHYVIFNRVIWSRVNKWVARPYTGANPHEKHLHVSILNNTSGSATLFERIRAENDTTPWFEEPMPNQPPPFIPNTNPLLHDRMEPIVGDPDGFNTAETYLEEINRKLDLIVAHLNIKEK